MGRRVLVRVDSNFFRRSRCVPDIESMGCVLLKEELPLKFAPELAGCE